MSYFNFYNPFCSNFGALVYYYCYFYYFLFNAAKKLFTFSKAPPVEDCFFLNPYKISFPILIGCPFFTEGS